MYEIYYRTKLSYSSGLTLSRTTVVLRATLTQKFVQLNRFTVRLQILWRDCSSRGCRRWAFGGVRARHVKLPEAYQKDGQCVKMFKQTDFVLDS